MATATEVWRFRGLVGNLVQRELKSQYKRSVLGYLWSLINPLSTLVIYALVFGVFLRIEPPVAGNGELKNFALYLFAALIVWNFFSGVVNGSMAALEGVGGLLKKVYFPPQCPALATTVTVLIQAAIETGLLVTVMIIVGNVSATFLLFPLLLALLVLFSLGIGLVVSLLNVYYKDVGYLVRIALNLLFYATPIIYPLSLVPEDPDKTWGLPVADLILLNPITHFTQGARLLLYELQVPGTGWMLVVAAESVVAFLVGWRLFSRYSLDVSEAL